MNLAREQNAAADLHRLLEELESSGASDLFLRPGKRPAVRRCGMISELDFPVVRLEDLEELFQRLAVPDKLERFEREGAVDIGYSLPAGGRLRLNFHRQQGLPALAARALPSGSLELAELRLPPELGRLAGIREGLVLVTGSTGSGKSTTMAALVHRVCTSREGHVVTVEDPIEFVHPDARCIVTQREVGRDTPSFSVALRHVVRENPDVIVIGEIRDRESVEVALLAALTGHLVLATLHTADAGQTLERLVGLFPQAARASVCAQLSLCLRGIVSLRLLPTCDDSGRVPAVELLTLTPGVARVLREQRLDEIPDLMRSSDNPSIRTFNRSILDLHSRGKVTYETGLAFSTNPDEFRMSVAGMRTGVEGFEGLAEAAHAGRMDLRSLLALALVQHASDVHLSVGRPPLVRVDGVLDPIPVGDLTAADVRRLLYSILSSHQQSILELEKELDLSLCLQDGTRFRVNAYHQRGHLSVAFRLIRPRIPTPEELGLPQRLVDICGRDQGLVLVVGPTGCGKTTTVASLIDRINRTRSCHVITIEDPVEYVHASAAAAIDQREVYSDTRSFATALKYVLRQDPDVIVVGEMRDLETISSVLTAAETGHLVFATLHTNDACQTVDRIVDVFPPHQQHQVRLQLSACLLGVVSQRLLRRCDHDGRIAAFELMLCNPAVRALIREGKTHQLPNVLSTSLEEGMVSLDRSLARLYQEGKVESGEAARFMSDLQLLDVPQVGLRRASPSSVY